MTVNVNYPFTRASNLYFDRMGDMTPSETKIVGMVIRHSVGWNNEYADISYTDFMRFTKTKSRTTVGSAIKSSIEKGYIAIEGRGKRGKTRYTIGNTLKDSTISCNPQIEESISSKVVPVIVPLESPTSTIIVPLIKKEVLKEKRKKIKDISRYARTQSFIYLISALDKLNLDSDLEKISTTESPSNIAEKPYTDAEYEFYYIDRKRGYITLQVLEDFIFNACHNANYSREHHYRKPKPNKLSDWNKLIAVVMKYFPNQTIGTATQIANQLRGKAKVGDRQDFNITPGMDAVEACAFAYWMREGLEREDKYFPRKAETIFTSVEEFRALITHFEHVNHARYVLDDLIASNQPVDKPDLTPMEFASQEEIEPIYADFEKEFGFSLAGSYG